MKRCKNDNPHKTGSIWKLGMLDHKVGLLVKS